jgi:hypothetical protein
MLVQTAKDKQRTITVKVVTHRAIRRTSLSILSYLHRSAGQNKYASKYVDKSDKDHATRLLTTLPKLSTPSQAERCILD